MYDYPRTHSPSPMFYTVPLPPSPKRSSIRRSHSPVPRIATLLPNHHHHSEYSPSSRAADISRLLDPAYSSNSSASSSGSSSRAYVDHRGDLHDPDYRDFPLYNQASFATSASRIRSTTTTSRKQRRTSASSARSHSATRDHRRYSNSQLLQHARPNWERSREHDTDEDDEDDVSDGESQSHFSPFSSTDSRAKRVAQYSSYFNDHIPLSSSPISLPENALQLDPSPFEEEDMPEESRKLHRCRRRSGENKKKEEISELKHNHGDDESQSQSIPHVEDGDFVPSCTHTLRRQWQTLSLRFRFGVFHAKQRLNKALAARKH